MSPAEIVTFGCRLNAYESAVIRERAREAKLDDAVVVNTCAVTRQAVRQARQAVRRARKRHPSAKLIVTGCAAQTNAAEFAAMPEVDRVLGNDEKLRAEHYRFGSGSSDASVRVGNAGEMRQARLVGTSRSETHSRAFLQVQNGCDHRCTFCIIPLARGPSRSVPLSEIVVEAGRLVAAGYNEIVLTGVDISDYGKDLPGLPGLGRLVRTILRELPELQRLRLSSIDCMEADDDLCRVFAEDDRLMPHMHISLQAGDDLILKRMKRRHLSSDSILFCRRMRQFRPDIVFGADLIAGFPTETAPMFQNSLRIVEDCGITYLHVFPFSARPGTPAARMPQLPGPVVEERAARLREAGMNALKAFFVGEIGHRRRVLVEKGNRGHTEHFAPVRFAGELPRGIVVDALLTHVHDDHIEARVGG